MIPNPDKIPIPNECDYGNQERQTCTQCNCALAYSEEGFLTCTNSECALLYCDLVDQTAEWRYYGNDDTHGADPTRCGMPINPLLNESSYGCKVLCTGRMSIEMRKIRRYTEWQTMPYKEKSQYDDFQTITAMAQQAGISKMIIDAAVGFHKKISDTNLPFRGENRDGIIAASIYIACRVHNYPRTPQEIATIFHLNSACATKGCKNALAIINTIEDVPFSQTNADAFIERYCSKLNLGDQLTKLCKFVSKKIEDLNEMNENMLPSVAAGVVYYIAHICRLPITKQDVKAVSKKSEVTINKCFKRIDAIVRANQLIPVAIQKTYDIVL